MWGAARWGALVALAAGVLVVGAPSATATENPVIRVTTTIDVVDPHDGLRSLREAFVQADLQPGDDTIRLGTGKVYRLDEPCRLDNVSDNWRWADLDHHSWDALTVLGNGSTIRQTATSGCWTGESRVIENGDGTLTLDHVTIAGGRSDDPCRPASPQGSGGLSCRSVFPYGAKGGGVGSFGPLILRAATIRNNSAGDGSGGGVWSTDNLTILDSTIAGNAAHEAGGIDSSGPAVISGSTIVGNRAFPAPFFAGYGPEGGYGGGIASHDALTVTNSTIARNRVDGWWRSPEGTWVHAPGEGGGIWAYHTLDMSHATVTGNLAELASNIYVKDQTFASFASAVGIGRPGAPICAIGGPVDSHGYNVVAGTCSLGAGPGDVEGATALGLAPLRDNGGPTLTRLPIDATLSIIAPEACSVATDQRSRPRPRGAFCEAGSVEIR